MDSFRLESFCVPEHYDIVLDFDMEQLEYQGRIRIELRMTELKDSFKIHSVKPVEIKNVKDEEGQNLRFEGIEYEMVRIYFNREIVGKTFIEIEFSAKVSTTLQGCYLSKNSKDEIMIISHFEPTFARQAIPCFDEPGFKTTFDLSVKAIGWNVISNMNGSKDETSQVYKFDRSPLMSLYLLHWSICKHPKITTRLGDTEISIYTDYPEFSMVYLDLAKDCLEYYNNIFQIPYPLPKMDLIAVYKMSVRAMENWGCITFYDHILYKKPSDNFEKYFRDSRTIAHEISHMWFGNLVTMNWWTDLWLNEGFARFMEFKCLESIRPLFNPWDKFTSEVLYTALNIDHPIEKSHPVEIDNIQYDNIHSFFDSISYLKGASVLRMMEDVMGKSFALAVNEYLKRFEWKNVDSDQFFDTMQEFTDFKIREMMTTWTRQSGYPLIELIECEGEFKVRQRPFDSYNSASWIVPIRYINDSGITGLFILDTEEATLPVKGNWIKLNYGSTGFYRVLYKNSSQIFRAAKTLPAVDRYGLLHDAKVLYKEGLIQYNDLNLLVESLIPEEKYFICLLLNNSSFLNKDQEDVKNRYKNLILANCRAWWDKYKLNGIADDPESSLIEKNFMGKLLHSENSEDIYQEVIRDFQWSKYYKECIILSRYSEEAHELMKSDKSFIQYALLGNNDKNLLRAAIEIIDSNEELLSKINDILRERAGYIKTNDQLILILVEMMTKETDSNIIMMYINIFQRYKHFKHPEEQEFLNETLSKLQKDLVGQELSNIIQDGLTLNN